MASNNKQGGSAPIAIWGTAAAIIVLAVYAVHALTRQRVDVHTAIVSYRNISKTVSTTGKVELLDDFQARSVAPGQVEAIYVSTGEHVHKGQVLLKLNDAAGQSTLAHAQAQLQEAEMNAGNIAHGGSSEERATVAGDLSRANFQRQQDEASLAAAQKLAAAGAASPAEVAAAQHRVQMDDTNIQVIQSRASQRYTAGDIATADAQVADARAAVAAARSALANNIIRTPIEGTVYYLPVAEHDYVDANENLVFVADLTKMRIAAYFDEPDIGALAIGQPVSITWQAKRGTNWHGHISQTPTTIIDYQNRFVGEAMIAVDDADGVLAPNANVNLVVTLAEHPHVLAVPRGALQSDAGGHLFVYRIREGKLARADVKIGLADLNAVEIVSGLSEGDTVATGPASNNTELTNGESVTAIPGP